MGNLLPCFVLLTLGIGLAYLLCRFQPDDRQWLLRVLGLALVVRLAVATAFALLPEIRVFHEDADGYEYMGMAICNGWRGAGPPIDIDTMRQNYGYPYLAAASYCTFGPYRAVPSYLNGLL